jgi:hypothetical protein
MTVDAVPGAALAPKPDLAESPTWSDAEFFDQRLPGGLVLRALICSLDGEWRWTVSSLDRDRGELIGTGTETTAAAARRAATSEIGKCLENGMA